MNPANIPNVGGGMPGGAQQHRPAQQNNEITQLIMHQITQGLQAQGPWTGWQAEVPGRDRGLRVFQIVTSLRLIHPRIEIQNATNAALSFEHRAFRDAKERADYDRECNQKLVLIRETRARQAAAMHGAMPQSSAPGMPGVGQPQHPQQMNRPMQASPVPGQQQMSMGMNDNPQMQQSFQLARQQRQQQQQQQQNPAMLQQPPQQPQMSRPQQQQRFALGNGMDELAALPPHERAEVHRSAKQLMANTGPEEMEKIQTSLKTTLTQSMREFLLSRKVDPLDYFFLCHCLSQHRRYKRSRMEMNRSQNPGGNPNNMMGGDPMMNSQQHQEFSDMMGLQRNSAFPQANQQGQLDTSFMGNVENIQGQQADGLRSQEAGQLVVPASSNQSQFQAPQNVFPQQFGQGGQASMNNAGISPQFLGQQSQPQQSQTPQVVQDRSQPVGQFQHQAQAPNQVQARAQAAHKAQLAMLQGQAGPHMQQPMTAQQNPAMPMLNRPMHPGQMSPAQAHTQPRPPGMGQQQQQQQQHAGLQSMGGQPMQGRPSFPGLPPKAQEQLAQMTPEQFSTFLNQQQRRALAANPALRANFPQQAMSMQPNMPQPGQGPQMAHGQMGGNQNPRSSLGQQQLLAGMGGAKAPNQMMPGQQMSLQQRQAHFQKMQALRHQGMEMSPDQVKEMDRLQVPRPILNNINLQSLVPDEVKSWGQFKQWVSQNMHVLGGGFDMQKLLQLQKYHLANILAQSKEGGRNADHNAQQQQPPWMQVPPSGQPQPFMNAQQPRPGQPQGPINIPQMRPITDEDIQATRQRLGVQAQNYTNDQLREILQRNRQKSIMNRMLAAQQSQQQPQTAQHRQQQPPVPTHTPQIQQDPQPQPGQQNQPPRSHPSAAGKGAKVANSNTKQPPNKRKQPDEESPVLQTTGAPKSTAQPPMSVAGVPPRPVMPFTREQLAAMNPVQRAQIEAQYRKQQQGQTRVSSRADVEAAFNRLPEAYRQYYANFMKNPFPIVSVSPEEKSQIAHCLRENTDTFGKMNTLLQFLFRAAGGIEEKNTQWLLRQRGILIRQFKPGNDWTVADHFTIDLKTLTQNLIQCKQFFAAMTQLINQHQSRLPGQRPDVSRVPPNARSSAPNMPALSEDNLQQLTQEQDAMQRNRRASSAHSGVGTGPLGTLAPDGVPQLYGPASNPPEKLNPPPLKKRKQSQPTNAAQTMPMKAQASKQGAADAMPVPMVGAFRCSAPECQHHHQGFHTQEALDKHVDESHKAEEPIDDPLEFALRNIDAALVKEEEKPENHDPKKTPAQADLKAGVTPSPMKQGVKLEGSTSLKGVSPSLAQQPTPAAKAPTSAAVKATPSKESQGGDKPTDQTGAKDPWANSAISLEAIHDTFAEFEGDLGLGSMDEFVNFDAFANGQAQDTPESVETGLATQTPEDNEAPKTEDEGGKLGDLSDDGWIPADWLNLPGRLDDGFPPITEPWDEVDWDGLDRKEETLSVDPSGIGIRLF